MGKFNRFHVCANPKNHKRWRMFARKHYHNNLSQTIHRAMEDLMDGFQNEENLESRLIMEHFDRVEERFDRVEEQVAKLAEVADNIGQHIKTLCLINDVDTKKLLADIVKVLKEAGRELFTEDVKEKLPEYSIREVRRGLEILSHEKFVVRQIEPEGEGGKTKWRLLGV